ncbi:MAG: ABC transporter ATP-binding protein, partial [Nocardioidaceae bacterium]
YMDEAERLADTIHVIDHGRLIASGSPFDLTRGTGHTTIRLVVTEPFPAGAPQSLQRALGPSTEVQAINPQSLLISGPADGSTLATVSDWCATHGVLPESMSLSRRTLEDVFLQLTGRELSQ